MITAEDTVEVVKANPEFVPATRKVLSYEQDMRPFYAVYSDEIVQLKAWLALRERPQDIDLQMRLFNYTAFSLACYLGHRDMVELLLNQLNPKEGADTSVPNYLGLTGRDLARAMHKQHPDEGQRAELRELLRKWSMEFPDKSLAIEEKRNRSRPVQAVPVERPELDYIRCGFWQQHEPGGQLTYW